LKKKPGFFSGFSQKNANWLIRAPVVRYAAGRTFRGSSAETVELGCCYSVTTTNESTDRQWSLHQDSTPCPAMWQSKNPLMMIYRALAEWKNGKSKVASETLSGIKGKSWESKVNAIRDGVGSCC